MKNALYTVSLCLLAALCFAFTAPGGNEDGGKDRLIVERLFDGQNLQLQKDMDQTRFNFRVAEGDSVRISCPQCYKLFKEDSNGKPNVVLSIEDQNGTRTLNYNDIENSWLGLSTDKGKFSVALVHGGGKEKNVNLSSFMVYRKTAEYNTK